MVIVANVTRRRVIPVLAASGGAVLALLLSSCSSSTSQSVGDTKDATVAVSQDGTPGSTPNPNVTIPFFITGTNFDAGKDVQIRIYQGTDTKGKNVFDTKIAASDKGALSFKMTQALALGQYAVQAQSGGEQPQTTFQVVTAKAGLTKVTWDGATGGLMSPAIQNGNLYIAQSANQGTIFQWTQADLPQKPGSETATAKPLANWTPSMPDQVKMEQINFDNAGKQLLVTKKSMQAAVTGGNSVFAYDYGSKDSGTQLAGNTAPAGNGYYAWGQGAGAETQPHNTAEGAFKYTSKTFPTKTPTTVSIGDGGGVVQANNGYYYFGSLQSGCVYKMTQDKSWADYVYCIPSWGANNQNQSVYSLAEDKAGNVYAVYQGATDNNTIVLKITPSGSQSDDKILALQVKGWARTVGLAVNSAGSTIYLNGTSMAQYDSYNTNSILAVTNPQWGEVGSPTANPPSSVTTISGTPWLTGMAYDEAKNVLYVADNTGGFYLNFR